VLEIGTGAGTSRDPCQLGAGGQRQAAPRLSRSAGRHPADAGYDDVQLVVGDGTRGWAAGAPYDAVIVTAAGPSVPKPLLNQLSPEGGRLVMPVGSRVHQELTMVEHRGDEFIRSRRDPVVFVPLIGAHGFGE
jgi:protein-L-isoaspartate(D-aspartate) O-methyltransferase